MFLQHLILYYMHVYTICMYIQSVCVYIYIYIGIYIHRSCNIEGSLEVKLPTIWADGKAEVGRVSEENEQKKCTPLWCEAHFKVKSVKN